MTIVSEIRDLQDSRTGLTSMMRSTAFPAGIVDWMAAGGTLSAVGVQPQDQVVNPALFIRELKKRGIELVKKEAHK